MQLRKFANPWCLLCGAVAGGLAWAVTLPVWAAFVIAVIIWLTAVLVFGFLFPTAPSETELPADPVAVDAGCARRAHAAAASCRTWPHRSWKGRWGPGFPHRLAGR